MNPKKFLDIVSGESERTKNTLKKKKPDQAILDFYARHDQIVDAVIKNSNANIACQSGCSFCCYLKVETKPVEIIAIIQHIEKNFSTDEINNVLKKAKQNVEEFKLLDYSTQVATNQACPFLNQDRCSIYEVRPAKCRNNHATDVSLCQKCFDNPTDNTIPSSYYKPLDLAVNGLVEGFESVLKNEKYDSTAYDINHAFIAAFNNPKFKKRYLKRKKALIKQNPNSSA